MDEVNNDSTPEGESRCAKFSDTVITDVGLRRGENQDSYGIAHTQEVSLYVVADGMGGARGGATASAIAVNVISEHAFHDNGSLSATSLCSAVEFSNDIIFACSKNDEDLSGMGTTVVALAFLGKTVIVAHVGDSRIYRFKEGSLEQLTRDHTLVQELVDSGAIQEEEAASHPIAHMLTRSLGPTDSVEVEVSVLDDEVTPKEKYLLCSDGLYNLVTDEEIAVHLQGDDLAVIAKELVDLALERGGTDNVTIEILEVHALEDPDTSIEYPTAGHVDITVSTGIESPSITEVINKLISEKSEESSQESDDAADAESTDEDLLLEETDDFEDFDTSPERGERFRTQMGMLAVIAVLLLTLGYTVYQYGALPSDAKEPKGFSREQIALAAKVFERESRTKESTEVDTGSVPQMTQELESSSADQQLEEKSTEDVSKETEAPLTTTSDRPESSISSEHSKDVDVETSSSASAQPTEAESSLSESSESQEDVSAVEKLDGVTTEDIKKEVNNITVPAAPELEIPDEEIQGIPADQPIVWENEENKIEKVLKKVDGDSSSASSSVELALATEVDLKNTAVAEDKIFTAEELLDTAEEKARIRSRIADTDVKLSLLTHKTAIKVKRAKDLLEARLKKIDAASKEIAQEITETRDGLRKWTQYKRESARRQKIFVGKQIAAQVPAVKEKLEIYSNATEVYRQSVEAWRGNPANMELASKMGAQNRATKKARSQLDQVVTDSIKNTLERLLAKLSETTVTKNRLQLRRAHLSRHIGYHEAFTPLSSARRRELRDLYLRDRRKLVAQLESLKKKLSDAREKEVRNKNVLDSLGPDQQFTENSKQ